MISAKNLSVGYGEKTILEHISFAIPEKSTTVIMGPGGSGKTTILKMLIGTSIDEELWYTGEFNYPTTPPFFCPQNKSFHPKGSLCEILQEHYPKAKSDNFLHSVWRSFPDVFASLKKIQKTPLCELPLGTAKLAYLSIALGNKYPYVILDEPERYLKFEEQQLLIKKIAEVKTEKTLVITTHNQRFSREVADFVMLFVYGELIECADRDSFFLHPKHDRTKQYLRYGS
ncbi:ATP-binding cassette domain-containing protein [Candidatus Uabimicrobium amorphum]|uniref:Arginine ABC transporter ATP-binding protein n=1 Tax=Uabimicrobium amorphum TaxID=2596890 RepID=A0A5S9IK25_UABAM|nr:ATP-binding cassette domain-containing protein [Candidatus Uabimicrobium amorphum]BBM82906.1 arginine ABC transporter ATP-binding protein [Candidatus Uabimicrobium amorphum]